MTESYLTTDIIVIIVLVVVLIVVGACAFFVHFYWTKIGVSEIWNTAKWSSMRSSFYRTVRRFSRANNAKASSERPLSAASIYSDDTDGSALPAPLRNKKPNVGTNPNAQISDTQTLSQLNNRPVTNTRSKQSNQIEPVIVSSSKSGRTEYATKINQPLEDTVIHNIHEMGDKNTDGPVQIHKGRF